MIRDATHDDFESILTIMREAGEMCPTYDYADMAGGVVVVAEESGRLVGYVRFSLARPETYIHSIAVIPEARRALWARLLIAEVWRRARAFGAQGLQGVASTPDAQAIWGARECVRLQPTVRARVSYTDYLAYIRTRAEAGNEIAAQVLDFLGEEIHAHA